MTDDYDCPEDHTYFSGPCTCDPVGDNDAVQGLPLSEGIGMAKLLNVQIIVTDELCGMGTEENPKRRVEQWFSPDDTLLNL